MEATTMASLKRPNTNEDDEEILRQQAEFLKNRAANKVFPAAKLIKANKENGISTTQQMRGLVEPVEDNNSNIRDRIGNTFEDIPTNFPLRPILERKHGSSTDISRLTFHSGGFPKVFKRDPSINPKSGCIFGAHMELLEKATAQLPMDTTQLQIGEKQLDGSVTMSTSSATKENGISTTQQMRGPVETVEDKNSNIRDRIENTFEDIPSNFPLRPISAKHGISTDISRLKFDSGGFPKASKRDPSINPKSGSIFAQHTKLLKKATDQVPMDTMQLQIRENKLDGSVTVSTSSSTKVSTAAERSTVLSSSDRQQIHSQNLETLHSMSAEEILAEKEKLLASLDPAIVQFLRAQSSKPNTESETRNKTIKEQNEAAEEMSVDQLDVPKEILSRPDAAGWLNFNEFEANKLAWMQNMPITSLKKTEGFEARFDFEGYLLPHGAAQITETNRHLFHHGDEPERPGYSLQELLLLSRSNIIQQRIIALNTLGNVLSLDQTGMYDQVIDIPIEQVFFVLRVCLDDNTPSVLTAAVKALRNLVYFQIDETCLDNMWSFGVGIIQPTLAVDETKEDDNTVNDQQLAEINLIKCLARTEILSRIRYIINSVKPQTETIIYCIEILTRLARDSEFIVNKMIQTEVLLSSLVKYFLPPTKSMGISQEGPGYNMPLPQMVKLITVLSTRSRTLAQHLLNKHNLLNIVVAYLYDDYFAQNVAGMRLQVECFHYWTVLIHYGLASDSIRQNEPFLMKCLDYHFQHTDNASATTLIRQSHLGALLILLAKIAEKGIDLFPDLSRKCFAKWISQWQHFDQYKCSRSQISSAILYYAAARSRYGTSIHNVELLETILDSTGFNAATANVINGSLLLNNYETHKTTANLKSLEAATWFSMDHIVPVMQTNSCIPFLYALSMCILSDKSSAKLKTKFLNDPKVKEYTNALKSAKCYFNMGNWFTRCESLLIMNLLKIAQIVQDRVDPSLYYDIAVKCLCVFSSEQKPDMMYLLENIVFCPRFYSVEVAMANIRLSERNEDMDRAWKHLDDIKKVYSDVLGLTHNTTAFDSTLTLDMSIGNVIPIDWIYTPLVWFYSTQQKKAKNKATDESKDLFIIVNCLRWIFIYETHFESLAKSISPTEKYVRLACLFLGSDNLFLNDEVQRLLTRTYQFLIKAEDKLNFEQDIAGLGNFNDFFVQLLEQYQAVSYGNKVFANVLLLPLVKRHNVKYRKTLWSEYMGVVETFSVLKDEVWIKAEDLIYPVDTDVSLYQCYSKALATRAVRDNSIMFHIASANTQQSRARN
ncbi:RNA polymerase II-associated protein 1 [Dendroctonus ponderosae]|uniref:RNA polymerase II-associated protein 1 n=1 Tax=Dendroctonus ponderosae TaxID=77166 RepID=UPI0020360ADD|nr:RNA polymerase II-associated protein 1 [Dendroctonus ponderosae]KAH1017245.1 hypothetical protein HUJ05_007918 [Dendroctonus ponderosae]